MSEDRIKKEPIDDSDSIATIGTRSKIEVVNYDIVARQFMAGLMIKYGEEEVKAAIESLVYKRIVQLKKAQRVAGLKEMINEGEGL